MSSMQLMKERQQKLLEGQQRDMDKRTELDELRARRAAEEKVLNICYHSIAISRSMTAAYHAGSVWTSTTAQLV